MKHVKVIERVYDPRRLRAAWRQVKQNAGAAGIDQMTVEAFERRKDELIAVIHEKLKAGNYRFWFRKQGLIFLHDFTQRQQPLELSFNR